MATTKTWTDFQQQLDLELKADAARLSAADKDALILRAAELTSADRPRAMIADLPATGAFDYDVPADWDLDESQALQVEFPAGKQEPGILDEEEWTIYRPSASVAKLRFLQASPNSGTIRLTYTIPYVLNEQSSTLPDSAFMAVIYKASQLACESLSAQYAKTSDPTIAADVVNYRTKSQEFSSLAERFRERYEAEVGRNRADGTIGEWDMPLVTGGPQLFHKPSWR